VTAPPILVALLLLSQAAPSPLPSQPGPGIPPTWPSSCQRLHLEVNKCENGWKSCNQHRVEYWRRRCARDEPRRQ